MTPVNRGNEPLVPHVAERSSFKIVGLGGVGGIVARNLLIFLESLGIPVRLLFFDGDTFEPRNAARMAFSDTANKAAVVCDDLTAELVPEWVTVVPVGEYVTEKNIERLIHAGDHVVLCVDNHATRKLVSEHCAKLEDVVLFSGGNDGVEKDPDGRQLFGTFGNVQIYLRKGGENVTPPLTEFHPEIADPSDRPPDDVPCTEAMKSVPQIFPANVAVASALLNAIWLHLCGRLHYAELAFDIYEGLSRPVELPHRLSGTGGEADAPGERRAG